MDYQELQDIVRKLDGQRVFPDSDKITETWNPSSLADRGMVGMMKPEGHDLLNIFKKLGKDEKWHAFVREIFWPPEKLQFLKDDLLRLVDDYTGSYHKEFKKREKGSLIMPKRMLELNRLHTLFNNFLQIYRNIIQNFHFENPIQQNYGKNINGKINWARTIQLSKTEFPTLFFTQTWQKEFERPGNILLILCLRWLHNTANTILHIDFDEELTDIETRFLVRVIKQTKNCLDNFPFPNVINYANRYSNLRKNHRLILQLKKHLQIELKQKIVRNPEYQKLLEWIDDFDNISFAGMSESDSNFVLETIKNIDLAYETWIFWKLVEAIEQRFGIKDLDFNTKDEYVEFVNEGQSVFLVHEKVIRGYSNPNNTPDFSIFKDKISDENLFCVYDSKNTDEIKREDERAILAYQQDLDCDFGGLISRSKPRKVQNKTGQKITWYTKLDISKEAKESNRKQLEELLDQISAQLMLLP